MVTKFALQVHLMWLHQLTDSFPVWLSFRGHRVKM